MRAFVLFTVLVGVLATFQPSSAQQLGEPHRIGWLWGGQKSPRTMAIVLDELQRRGWIEGENIVLEHRWAGGNNDRLAELAAELVALDVSLILASQSTSTVAAKRATSSIPIVMVGNGDPVRYGLVTNLARPEANVTGVSFLVNEMAAKLVESLKQMSPDLSRLAVFVNGGNPGAGPYVEVARTVAGSLGFETLSVDVREPDDFEPAFHRILRAQADALLLPPEGLIGSQRHRIMEFAARNGLLVGGNHPVFVEAGAQISYSPHWRQLAERAASFVDRILNGAQPGELPVERPAAFELVLNLGTARDLGLSIPPGLLLLATKVVE